MSKLKQFLKTYAVWLIIGALVGGLIAFVIISKRKGKKDISSDIDDLLEFDISSNTSVKKIESPYISLGYKVDMKGDVKYEDFQEREWIYLVTIPDTTTLTNSLRNFYKLNEQELDSTDNGIILQKGDDLISYNINNQVLSIYTTGLSLDPKITKEKEIISFFNKYFDVKEVINERKEDTERGTLYQGYFNYHGRKVGSSSLEGYAYKLEIDKRGNLLELSMLFLKEENLQKFQPMKTISFAEIRKFNNYPMLVGNKTIESYFYNQSDLLKSSVKLDTLVIKQIDPLFIFNDSSVQYIIPTYRIYGDGELIDSKGGEYKTTSYIFVCAIDPEYLYEKLQEDFIEQLHPMEPF